METTSIEIPNKSHFKLNEVCGLTGVKPYVLRFWEAEFEEIAPILSASGQKLYEHKDIEAIALVKKLLYDDKYSVERAKLELKLLTQAPEMMADNFEMVANDDLLPSLPEEAMSMDQVIVDELAGENAATVAMVTEAPKRTPFFQRSLSDQDIQKLMQAKIQLQSLIELTHSLQQKHHWL